MSNDELKLYIKSMLGESYVDIELTDEDINHIVKQTLDKVAPYYDGRRFILGQGKVINLSEHPGIKEVVNVYDTRHTNIMTLQDYVFGGSGIMIYSANLIDKLQTYTCYQMLYNEFNSKLSEYLEVKTGVFGADMLVHILNDGPVTISIDSKCK